ncbi:LacI family transcriptional regulator [Ktedonobacter sp. SOSP1-85]|uniref:LacI family transcriptional regulator n=1 Tax=Ktedonobacter robiniae TaxID=2778365 RepID=A0ABQ3UZY5_9CHLR|nr:MULTISPECIES: LacI family DNA-binding transcriptional regulator [Ktedonobacter]GHO58451.1 LacI family transcriptional regulator [Ktedonobacter robiniae]GHO79831.1 LacI family transcriptional regulator [Ktedonobacter sp. SOSP1-85]
MKNSPKMSDIAKRAGVTLSTVSYTLSGKRPISDAVKQKVYQAMEELGYQPNSLARALVTKRTRIIALLYPAWSSKLGPQSEFITSIAASATDHGYALLLWTSPLTDDEKVMDMTHQGFIDGAILMEVALHDPRVELLQKQHVPFVMIGRYAENADMSFVDLDFDYALETSVRYLVEEGHRHIVLINQSAELLERGIGYVVRSRDAFYREMQKHGLQGIDCCCEANDQAGYEATTNLLNDHPAISAFILMTPWPSGGIIRALTDKGLRIPEDVSLVAIFSPHLAQMTMPALTSVDFPFEEMGRLGAQILVDKLNGIETAARQVLLTPPLTIRSSSGPHR